MPEETKTLITTSLNEFNCFYVIRPDGREIKIYMSEFRMMKDPKIPGPKKLTTKEFEDLKIYIDGER